MADSRTPAEADASRSDESRSVIAGSFRRTFGETRSRLLKSYVVVSALFGVLFAVLLVLALPVWVLNTLGSSELGTFSRAFLIVGGVLVLVPLVAPVLSAGQRHARGTASGRADFLLALSGYLFVLSLYAALLVSAPPSAREAPPPVVAPVVELLYALPPTFALAPPLLAAAVIGLVHRFAE